MQDDMIFLSAKGQSGGEAFQDRVLAQGLLGCQEQMYGATTTKVHGICTYEIDMFCLKGLCLCQTSSHNGTH